MRAIDRRAHRALSVAPVVAASSLAVLAFCPTVSADEVTLSPSKDNTLFSATDTSSGAGQFIFSGQTGNMVTVTTQRAVIEWDVAGEIPAGSTITSVSLQVYMLGASPFGGPETHSLHRIEQEWGEGTSMALGGAGAPATTGDATWLQTFFPDEFWTNEGGDFDATASASTTIATQIDFYSWSSTPAMVADVQGWLDDDAGNHGWLMRGNDEPGSLFTSRKFASREWVKVEQHPLLTIQFDPPASRCPDVDDDNDVDFQDLLILLVQWSPDPGSCPGCPADVDGDDDVDFQDLLVLLAAWGPCP